jgi:4-hydroxy-tetrahydrodipicolinate synthase
MTPKPFSGVLVPALTPFHADLTPDAERYAGLLKFLLAEGADGLAIFGTTSEGNSLTVAERNRLIDHVVAHGIPAARLMPGTGACAIPDAVEMTRHAVNAGAGGVLMLPPFYYKNQSDDGFYGYFSELIQRVGDERLRIYLYHFPQMSAAPISLDLIARLHGDYPKTVIGLKDSSGDWETTKRMIADFPDMAIFPSSETRLLEGLPLGAAGCISATANIQAGAIRRLIDAVGTPEADSLHEQISALRSIFENYPLIAALKANVARDTGDKAWLQTRPPITPLPREKLNRLLKELDSTGQHKPVRL